MMRVTYAGASFLTSDEIAKGLFRFVAALGEKHEAEALEVPAFADDGRAVLVQLVVGPASELLGVPEESVFEEPDSVDFVSELHRRTLALSSPRPVVDTEGSSTSSYAWDDLESP